MAPTSPKACLVGASGLAFQRFGRGFPCKRLAFKIWLCQVLFVVLLLLQDLVPIILAAAVM